MTGYVYGRNWPTLDERAAGCPALDPEGLSIAPLEAVSYGSAF